MSVYYNKANGVLTFDAYQGSNDFHGFINVGTGLSFNVASVGTTLADPTSVTPPASAQLLGRFTGTVLTNYKGTHHTLTGPWRNGKVQATGPGRVTYYPARPGPAHLMTIRTERPVRAIRPHSVTTGPWARSVRAGHRQGLQREARQSRTTAGW